MQVLTASVYQLNICPALKVVLYPLLRQPHASPCPLPTNWKTVKTPAQASGSTGSPRERTPQRRGYRCKGLRDGPGRRPMRKGRGNQMQKLGIWLPQPRRMKRTDIRSQIPLPPRGFYGKLGELHLDLNPERPERLPYPQEKQCGAAPSVA